MQLLEEKIKTDGVAVNEDILKVDSFINHKVDPFLMKEIGKDFASHFAGQVLLLPLQQPSKWESQW